MAPNTTNTLSPGQPEPTTQMRGPSVASTGTLHFTEQGEIDAEDQDRMSQYLWEQSSIAGCYMRLWEDPSMTSGLGIGSVTIGQ